MVQRSLRLGDIVDDYCPRERRVTNHAIVALVDNVIRQTRCSTCQVEHDYKEAKVPKKKVAGGVLVTPKPAAPPEPQDVEIEAEAQNGPVGGQDVSPAEAESGSPNDVAEKGGSDASEDAVAEVWTGHRPLIRASLPRTDNDPPPPRVIPEFTMHQRHGRGFGGGRGFRHGHPGGHSGGHSNNGHEPDGNRPSQPGRPPGAGGVRRRRRRRPPR